MNINPYESPRVGEPMKEQAMEGPPGGDDSVRQLLVEIRNGQREMLELQREAVMQAREALVRTQRFRPFSYVMIAISMLVMIAMPLYSIMRIRNTMPTILPAARAMPPTIPVPRPTTKATSQVGGGDDGV